MGGANSIVNYDYQYDKERTELRLNLIRKFEDDPKSRDILGKIHALRELLIEHPHINRTAAQEQSKEENIETGATGVQAAYNELDRLFTLYETCSILRSVQCRIGTVACPLGHFAAFFDDFIVLQTDKKSPIPCSICDKNVKDGYHCSYCFYSLCVPCSVVYCPYGHGCKLWTHAESQHVCVICKKQPITGGYRCPTCFDYDICDYCSWKEGRAVIQEQILARIAVHLKYLEDHTSESKTAMTTMTNHKKKLAAKKGSSEETYATTLDLFDFSETVLHLRETAVLEVKQTRLERRIDFLRSQLVIMKEYSVTAVRESLIQGNYVAEERDRLERVFDRHCYLRSQAVRKECHCACPLGHGLVLVTGDTPPVVYKTRFDQSRQKKEKEEQEQAISNATSNNANSSNNTTAATRKKKAADHNNKAISYPPTLCKVCGRVATPSVHHCDYCEYDLCDPCSTLYDREGHAMTMWTQPSDGLESCFLCNESNLSRGYNCSICHVSLCDACTTKEQRQKVRTNWEEEMKELVAWMQSHKRLSDIAMYYQWRFTNQIQTTGRLVDYVHELRTGKKRAEKQIQQKAIIDTIKSLRAELSKYTDLCKTAEREIARQETFVFPSKKAANAEASRLASILKEMILLQTVDRRQKAGIACPLGHAMSLVVIEDENDYYQHNHNSLKDDENNSVTTPIRIEDVDGNKDDVKKYRRPQSATTKEKEARYSTPVKATTASAVIAEHEISNDNNDPKEESKAKQREEETAKALSPIKQSKQLLLDLVHDTMRTVHSPAAFDDHSNNKEATNVSNINVNLLFHSLRRACRVCGSFDIHRGHTCSLCEYDLCSDCSIVYCRQGHPLRLWTMPEAISLSCDMCKKAPITAGYRCMTCEIDICDRCTTRDCRNAFMLWPRREFHRIVQYLDHIQRDSPAAKEYLESLEQDKEKRHLASMSLLCRKLAEVTQLKAIVEEEVRKSIQEKKVKNYGAMAREMY